MEGEGVLSKCSKLLSYSILGLPSGWFESRTQQISLLVSAFVLAESKNSTATPDGIAALPSTPVVKSFVLVIGFVTMSRMTRVVTICESGVEIGRAHV